MNERERTWTMELWGWKPATQGSMQPVSTRYMRHANPMLRAWRDELGWAFKDQLGAEWHVGGPLPMRDCGVQLEATFYMERPKSARKRPLPHTRSAGDLDKLVRAVGDALEGLAWRDDSQITTAIVRKRYIENGEEQGVKLSFRRDEGG